MKKRASIEMRKPRQSEIIEKTKCFFRQVMYEKTISRPPKMSERPQNERKRLYFRKLKEKPSLF